MTSQSLSTAGHSASFASLPREIRDQIYSLVFIENDFIDLPTDQHNPTFHPIFHVRSSSSFYALEARTFFLQQNEFFALAEALPQFLDPLGNTFFDFKGCLRSLFIHLNPTALPRELAEQVALLMKCSALQKLNVFIDPSQCLGNTSQCTALQKLNVFIEPSPCLGNNSQCIGCIIDCNYVLDAFEVLSMKLGRGLTFELVDHIDWWRGDFKDLEEKMKVVEGEGIMAN